MTPSLFTIGLGVQFACPVYVLLRGGAPERIMAAAITIGLWLTVNAPSVNIARYHGWEPLAFLIDLIFLAIAAAVAIRANRFWPVWLLGCHGMGVLAHLARLVDPYVLATIYHAVTAYAVYPMWAILVAASWRHRRRLADFGTDPSWKPSSRRSMRGPDQGGPR